MHQQTQAEAAQVLQNPDDAPIKRERVWFHHFLPLLFSKKRLRTDT